MEEAVPREEWGGWGVSEGAANMPPLRGKVPTQRGETIIVMRGLRYRRRQGIQIIWEKYPGEKKKIHTSSFSL